MAVKSMGSDKLPAGALTAGSSNVGVVLFGSVSFFLGISSSFM
jgi:hypothetical protein